MARLPLLVWLSGARWAIEQCFEEAKTDLGMDQYEVRKYAGWHYHMLTTMLAHFFLWHLQIRLKKSPAITVSLLRILFEVVFPFKSLTIEDILQLVAGRQQHHHRALLSHRKSRIYAVPGKLTCRVIAGFQHFPQESHRRHWTPVVHYVYTRENIERMEGTTHPSTVRGSQKRTTGVSAACHAAEHG
jgi:hypothetical protein